MNKEKKKKNPNAQALGKRRWKGKSMKEKKAHANMMVAKRKKMGVDNLVV